MASLFRIIIFDLNPSHFFKGLAFGYVATLSCLNVKKFGSIPKGSISKEVPQGTELFQSGG